MTAKRLSVPDLISIQSLSFLRIVFVCLAQALPIYQQNKTRPPVAGRENIESSAALMVLVAAIESHVNRLMYFESKGLSTDNNLLKKLNVYLPQKRNRVLLKQLEEVTVSRDAIVHAHVWEEWRQYDRKGNLTRQSWKVAQITHLRGKTRRSLAKRRPVSRHLRLNLMPTNVSYIDIVKSLVVALCLLCELEKRYGNPKAVIGPFSPGPRLARIFLKNRENRSLEDWVGGALRFLHPADRKEVEGRLRLRVVAHERMLVAGGFLPRGYSYGTPYRRTFITVPT